MIILLSTIIGVIGFFILLFLSTNLTGMVVRGFFSDAELQRIEDDKNTHDFIKNEIKKYDRGELFTTIVSIILLVGFLFLMYKYLTIWALVATLMLMISRIPDLLWEIKNGKKTTMDNIRKGFFHTLVGGLLTWLALPVFWWTIYSLLA